ncbi:MAG: MoaD/ThiS family protein [Planctomycetales bacterium]|nr:MoaD/ThiS family protein [Planctomycetales bacterium]
MRNNIKKVRKAMQVNVTYSGRLRDVTGCSREVATVAADSTVGQLLRKLVAIHGDGLRSAVLQDDGRLLGWILVSLNDRQVVDLESERLCEGDEVTILSAISGG